MTAGFVFALSRLRFILLPLLFGGVFATAAFAQSSPAPLYRVAGSTSGKALSLKVAATAPAGQPDPSGRVTKLDRASLTSLATLHQGMQVTLPLTDAVSVAGTVNLVQVAQGWTRSGGSLDKATPGTFYLAVNGAKVNGFILRPDLQVAYRFETLVGGDIVLREVPINAVVCGFLPPFLNDPTQHARTNAAREAVVPPILNSRPDAVAQLYLDFDGETVTDPVWAGGQTIVADPPDVTASDINAIFTRVKEDYWPFNINVTTDVEKYNDAPVGSRMRCIITPTDTAAPGAGGVAILHSFAEAGQGGLTTTVPCWVFNGSVIGISEAISHEFGHTFGLRHDGRELPGTGHEEYFLGQGDGPTGWCPIMGAAYYKSVSQWSIGEYQYANNQEDDVAVISNAANGFGYVPDEAGGTAAMAVPLTGNGGTVNQEGVITKAGDADYYSFTTTGGTVSLSATLAPVPNLDIVLEIQRNDGTTVVANNPPDDLHAAVTTTLPRGFYYLKVTDSGAHNVFTDGYSTYGSIGAYTIGGDVPGFGVGLLPNLTFTAPTGANDKLVISNARGTRTEPQTFYATDEFYLDFSVLNNGDAPAMAITRTAVYVDDVLRGTVSTPADFATGTTSDTDDFDLGMLSAGQHTIRLQADNSDDLTETSEIDNSYSRTIFVTLPGPPVIYSPATASGQVGVLFYAQVQATNQPTYSADNLPPGLYLKENTNIITGTPTVAGTFKATVTATNLLGSDTKTLTISITPAVPALASPGQLFGEVGTPFAYQISAANVPAGYGATGLPPGLTVDRATGVVSGTPTVAGTFPVSFQAINAGGTGTTSATIQILVAAPVFTSAPTAQGRVGKPFNFAVTATNATAGYTATGLPGGLTFDAASGLIAGTPTTAGTFPVALTATNANRAVNSTLTLTITAAPPIAAWGLADATTIPADLDTGDVVALAAGAAHSLALKGDGTVEAWGLNDLNQLNVPAGLGNVVAISAGAYHNLALRRDGTVLAWGSDLQRQSEVPAGLKDVVSVSAGLNHSLALKSDGTVIAWGGNAYGQARPPTDLKGVVGIAAGGYHSLALKGDGTVVGWGSNGSGQVSIPASLTGVKQIAAGLDFSVLLRSTGSVIALGSNTAGQLVLPAGLLDITTIAAGGQHALAVHQNGTVAAWGSNVRGESTPPAVLSNVALVAAGSTHSLALVQPGAPRVVAALPANGTAFLDGAASLVAYGAGTGPVAYQWAHNGVDIANANLPYLSLSSLTAAQTGAYTVRLTNPAGSVTSAPATLTVSAVASPTITVAATTSSTTPGSRTPGVFTLTRTGDASTELIVNYMLKGTASNGTDYQFLKGSKKLKAGKTSAQIKVVATGSLGNASQKTVKFTLAPGSGYTVGTTEAVKVKIFGVQE